MDIPPHLRPGGMCTLNFQIASDQLMPVGDDKITGIISCPTNFIASSHESNIIQFKTKNIAFYSDLCLLF